MKVTEHAEKLLRQGRKPKELVELGFPKRVITRVSRKLREEKRSSRLTNEEGGTSGERLPRQIESPSEEMAKVLVELQSLADQIQNLEDRVEALETQGAELKKAQIGVIPGPTVVVLKPNLICDCGESNRIALHLKCLECEKDHWWYWNLDK